MNIMDRAILCAYILEGCPENHWNTVITEYCIENGKDPELIKTFLDALHMVDPFGDIRAQMIRHILNEQAIAQNIVCVYDRNNQLISAY